MKLLQRLVLEGFDVTLVNSSGNTALHIVCLCTLSFLNGWRRSISLPQLATEQEIRIYYQQQLMCAKLLIQGGACITQKKNHAGFQPLQILTALRDQGHYRGDDIAPMLALLASHAQGWDDDPTVQSVASAVEVEEELETMGGQMCSELHNKSEGWSNVNSEACDAAKDAMRTGDRVQVLNTQHGREGIFGTIVQFHDSDSTVLVDFGDGPRWLEDCDVGPSYIGLLRAIVGPARRCAPCRVVDLLAQYSESRERCMREMAALPEDWNDGRFIERDSGCIVHL